MPFMLRHDDVEKPRNFPFSPNFGPFFRDINSSFTNDFRVRILEKNLSQIRVSHFFFLNQIRVLILSNFYFGFGADFEDPTY